MSIVHMETILNSEANLLNENEIKKNKRKVQTNEKTKKKLIKKDEEYENMDNLERLKVINKQNHRIKDFINMMKKNPGLKNFKIDSKKKKGKSI